MASELNVKGLSELSAALQEFGPKLEANILRGALRAGQKVILDAAKQNIHSISGDLAKSLRISVKSNQGVIIAKLKVGDKKAYYANWVEFGTQAHVIKAKGGKAIAIKGKEFSQIHHPGIKPKPFMRPALDANAQQAVEAVAEYISKRITKEQLARAESEQQ